MRRKPIHTALVYTGVAVFVVTTLMPVAWLAIMSVSNNNDLTALPLHWIPRHIDVSRYVIMLTPTANSPGEAFLYAFRNSLGAAGGTTIVSLLAGIPAAYSFSRFPQRHRSSLLYVALATYMLPPVAIVLPIYIALGRLHLLNHVTGLIIVYCSILLPFMTWLLKSNIDAVPIEIEQAAALDGAYTSNFHAKTLTVAIADFASGRTTDYPLISTAGLLASIPPVVIAFFLQKSLVKGFASGGVKG
jgi:multiple sugar transport system permease protein